MSGCAGGEGLARPLTWTHGLHRSVASITRYSWRAAPSLRHRSRDRSLDGGFRRTPPSCRPAHSISAHLNDGDLALRASRTVLSRIAGSSANEKIDETTGKCVRWQDAIAHRHFELL